MGGWDIGVSKQLGHRSITTTAKYLDHIAPLAVIEAMRRREWVGPLCIGLSEPSKLVPEIPGVPT